MVLARTSLLWRAGSAVGRVPFTVGLTIVLWILAAGTGSLRNGPPLRLEALFGAGAASLGRGEWWTPLTTALLAGPVPASITATAVVVGLLGLAERTLGSWRAIAVFAGGQVLAVGLYFATVSAGVLLGSEWLAGMRSSILLGPSAGAVAAAMAASARISILWRRRLRQSVLATVAMLLMYLGHPQDLLLFCGAVAGLALAPIVSPVRVRVRAARSTGREVRARWSMIVAVFAVGPVLARLAHAPLGPLAALRNLVINPLPTAAQLIPNCRAAVDLSCSTVVHGPGLNGPGTVVLSIVPLLLLLACAEGLRRGSRAALWGAVVLQLILGVLSVAYLQLFAQFGRSTVVRGRVIPVEAGVIEILPVVLVPLALAFLLLRRRRYFAVDPDPQLRRRILLLVGTVFGACVGSYAVAWFAEDNYRDRDGLPALLAALPRMFLPYPFPFRYAISVYPHGFFSTLLFSFGGSAFWIVSVIGVLLLFLRRTLHPVSSESDRGLAQQLVRRGGGSLSWMATWPGNSFWFNREGTVGLAYQIHYNVAVTLGGPFGNPSGYARAAADFSRWCAAQSLTVCWYSVAEDTARDLAPQGFRSVAVAEETLLPLADLDFRGKEWQNVRTALNRARRMGITAQWCSYRDLPAALRTQLHELSEAWVAEKALPELGFTLGGVEELKDDAVRLCLAVDGEGALHGVTSWLPVYRDGVVASWTLDFLRRGPDGFPGVMEFLIASVIQRLRGEVDVVSLSGSPLVPPQHALASAKGDGGGDGGADVDGSGLRRLLDGLGKALEPVYGFRSLAAFKARFQPQYRTLYLLYDDPLSLASIARAVAEAYLPNQSLRQRTRLLRTLVS